MAANASVVVIGAREVVRLRERYLTRATAVFYARIALLVLGLGTLLIPSWKRAFNIEGALPWVLFVAAFAWAVGCQTVAAHAVHGRRVMFVTLILDLIVAPGISVGDQTGLQFQAVGVAAAVLKDR